MKRTFLRLGTVCLLSGFFLLFKPGVEYAVHVPPVLPALQINAWVANFNPRAAAKALHQYPAHVSELSVFGVGGDKQGGLAIEKDFIKSALAAVKRQKTQPRVLLTVANIRRDSMGDRTLLRQWFGTPKARFKHIKDLVRLAQSADGLDIDYENLRPQDGRQYTRFLIELAQALHARGKYLSVTVEPNLLLYGSVNWKLVSMHVDRVRVMAYPFHFERTRPGPVSPPSIVRRLAVQGLKHIPPEKLEIALAVYGFDWVRGERGRLVKSTEQYKQYARRSHARVFRDAKTQCARTDYTVRGADKKLIRHEVWFEDSVSVAHKVKLLQAIGIRHIGLWQLGAGDITHLFELVNKTS